MRKGKLIPLAIHISVYILHKQIYHVQDVHQSAEVLVHIPYVYVCT